MHLAVTYYCNNCDNVWTQEIEWQEDELDFLGDAPSEMATSVPHCERCLNAQSEEQSLNHLIDATPAPSSSQQPQVPPHRDSSGLNSDTQPGSSDATHVQPHDVGTPPHLHTPVGRVSNILWTLEEKRALLQLSLLFPQRNQAHQRRAAFRDQFPYTDRTARQLSTYYAGIKDVVTIRELDNQIAALISPSNWSNTQKLTILKLCQDHPDYDFKQIEAHFNMMFTFNDKKELKAICSMWYELKRTNTTVAQLEAAISASQA